MEEMTNNDKKNDELDDLIPDKVVGGYKIVPWTLAKIKELFPLLQEIGIIFVGEGITLRSLNKSLTEKPNVIMKVAVEYGAQIISISLGIDINEAGSIDVGRAIEILFSIFFMNLDFIKNSFGLVERVKEEMVSSRR